MSEVAAPTCPRAPAFDVHAFAAAMLALTVASDEELLRRGIEARAWARRYDWNTTARAQEAFYLEIMEANRTLKLDA